MCIQLRCIETNGLTGCCVCVCPCVRVHVCVDMCVCDHGEQRTKIRRWPTSQVRRKEIIRKIIAGIGCNGFLAMVAHTMIYFSWALLSCISAHAHGHRCSREHCLLVLLLFGWLLFLFFHLHHRFRAGWGIVYVSSCKGIS